MVQVLDYENTTFLVLALLTPGAYSRLLSSSACLFKRKKRHKSKLKIWKAYGQSYPKDEPNQNNVNQQYSIPEKENIVCLQVLIDHGK